MAPASNAPERRQQIIRGLMKVMATQGYEGASTQAMARAAGLTPGLVHYHFRTKEEVLLGLLDHLADTLNARIAARVEAAGSGRARVLAFLDALVALGPDADEDAVACWVLIGAEAVRQRSVRQAWQGVVSAQARQLAGLLEAAHPSWPRSRHHEVAVALLAAAQGWYQLGLTAPGLVPRGSAAADLRRMLAGLEDTPRATRQR